MPAYTSVSFSFDRPTSNKIVEQFYAAFISEEISFKSVMPWGCEPNKSLKEIIEWNQSKIDSNFIPGMDTDISLYTWQVFLNVSPFSECRLILSFEEHELDFRCIVPECEVTLENSIILEKAALRVWNTLPVKLIETSGELGDEAGYQRIKYGVHPSVYPFAIIDNECARLVSNTYFLHKKLKRGLLVKQNPTLIEPIIITETNRIAKEIGPLAKGVVFSDEHIQIHGINDAVEQLVGIMNETNVELADQDYHQLSFIAYQMGIDFPDES